jgi:hypothetical protein
VSRRKSAAILERAESSAASKKSASSGECWKAMTRRTIGSNLPPITCQTRPNPTMASSPRKDWLRKTEFTAEGRMGAGVAIGGQQPSNRSKGGSDSPLASEIDHHDYGLLLSELRERIRAAQVRSALAVNRELILLYWEIGGMIVERQEQAGWGSSLLDQISRDLSAEFPGVDGFSRRNLYRMRALFLTYRGRASIVSQLVAQLPWGHTSVLIEKVKDDIAGIKLDRTRPIRPC